MSVMKTALVHNNEIAKPEDFNAGFKSSYTNLKQLMAVNGKKDSIDYLIGGIVVSSDNTGSSVKLTIKPLIGYKNSTDNLIVSTEDVIINLPLTADQKLYEIGIRLKAEETDVESRKVIEYDNEGVITDENLTTRYTYNIETSYVVATGKSVSQLGANFIKLCEVLASSSEVIVKNLHCVSSTDYDSTNPHKNWSIEPQYATRRLNTIYDLECLLNTSLKTINTTLEGKQPMLSWDNEPTKNSENSVNSGKIYQAITNLASKNITSLEGYIQPLVDGKYVTTIKDSDSLNKALASIVTKIANIDSISSSFLSIDYIDANNNCSCITLGNRVIIQWGIVKGSSGDTKSVVYHKSYLSTNYSALAVTNTDNESTGWAQQSACVRHKTTAGMQVGLAAEAATWIAIGV